MELLLNRFITGIKNLNLWEYVFGRRNLHYCMLMKKWFIKSRIEHYQKFYNVLFFTVNGCCKILHLSYILLYSFKIFVNIKIFIH